MSLDYQMITLAVTHCEDPAIIKRLVEETRSRTSFGSYPPKVSFDGDWAKTMQRRGVDVASFAARYCHDADAAREIYFSTKRKTVKLALASSPHLTPENARFFLAEAAARNDKKILAALGATASELLNELEAIMAKGRRQGLSRVYTAIRRCGELTPELAKRIVDLAIKYNSTSMLQTALHDWYLSGPNRRWSLAKGMDSPESVMDAVPEKNRAVFYHSFAHDFARAYLTVPVDASLASAWIEYVDPAQLEHQEPLGVETISPEAIELLWSSPAWRSVPMLLCQPLSEEAFTRALESRDVKLSSRKFLAWTLPFNDPRAKDRILRLKDWYRENILATPANYVDASLDIACEYESVLGSLLSEKNLLRISEYLRAQLPAQTMNGYIQPLPEHVEPLVRLISKTTDTHDFWHSLTPRSGLYNQSSEYKLALAKHAPFILWRYCISDKAVGQFVWDRINATGYDPLSGLDMLCSNPTTTLEELCELLGSLRLAEAS